MKYLSRRRAAVAVAVTTVGIAAVVAAVAPTSGANAATSATSATSAASTNHWRLANVWARTEGQFYSVASSGPKDAWAVGITGPQPKPTGPLAAHWNGKAWQTAVVPGSKGLVFDQVAESSSKNVWIIGEPSKPNVNSTAFIFNGSHWHTLALPIGPVNQLVVYGPNNVWVANDNYCSSNGCTENIYHWTGTTWQYRPLQTFLYALTGPSVNSLWAVGLSGSGSGYLTAYRWTGTQWAARSIPKVKGALSLGAAASSTDVWISSDTANYKQTYVLHGTSKGWKQITAPSSVSAFTVPVPDGHGGVWLDSQAYWNGSKWLAEWQPATYTEGWTGINAAFLKAPGTTGSYWSAGYTQASSKAATHPAVTVFGSLP